MPMNYKSVWSMATYSNDLNTRTQLRFGFFEPRETSIPKDYALGASTFGLALICTAWAWATNGTPDTVIDLSLELLNPKK